MAVRLSLYNFIQLDEIEQIEAYWEGVFVGTYKKNGKEFECKQIEDFYVEYRIEDGRFYRDMKCHKNPNLIEPYLGTEPLNI